MSDDALLAELAEAHRSYDPPPENLTAVAMRAFTWDAHLAELIDASTEQEPVLVRSSTEQTLDWTFEVEDDVLEVSIEFDGQDGQNRLHGMVLPPRDSVVIYQPNRNGQTVECDSSGRFSAIVSAAVVSIGFVNDKLGPVRTPLLDMP